MRFNPAEYETVDERIKKFYQDHPEGSIRTELASDPADWSQCRYTATVIRGDGTVWSTGYAYEVAGQSTRDGANFGSHEENCETSAIGRALANAGYSGAKRPSREEMNSAKSTQEAQKPKGDDTARKRIADEMKELAKERGEDIKQIGADFKSDIFQLFGVASEKANAHQLGSAWTSFKKRYETPIDEDVKVG